MVPLIFILNISKRFTIERTPVVKLNFLYNIFLFVNYWIKDLSGICAVDIIATPFWVEWSDIIKITKNNLALKSIGRFELLMNNELWHIMAIQNQHKHEYAKPTWCYKHFQDKFYWNFSTHFQIYHRQWLQEKANHQILLSSIVFLLDGYCKLLCIARSSKWQMPNMIH